MIDNTNFNIPDIPEDQIRVQYKKWYENIANRNLNLINAGKVGDAYNLPKRFDHWHVPTKLYSYPQMRSLLETNGLSLSYKRGLDIGCGTVTFFDFVEVEVKIVSDIVFNYCIFMRNKGHVPLVSDIEHLPFNDSTFDIIVCSDILEHVLSFNTALSELLRVIEHNGILLVNVPWKQEVHGTITDFSHVRTFNDMVLDNFNPFSLIASKIVDYEGNSFIRTVNMVFRKEI